jgi:hypothetical protein
MKSGHTLTEQYSRKEKLEAWVGPPPGANTSRPSDKVTLSCGLCSDLSTAIDEAREAYGLDDIDEFAGQKIGLLKRLIELFTGHKIKVLNPSELNNKNDTTENVTSAQQRQAPADTALAGWGVRYDLQESYTESEQTSFAVQGIVKTSDGREIAFNLNLEMSRDFVEQTNVSVRLGDATRVDPLVLNFDGTAAELTDWKFQFDLDSDGTSEEIPFVTSGSAVLVFDKNGDGQVNNGNELFGPSTGNGFAELTALDEDHNNWIDESDSAFSHLYVWQRLETGDESLQPLSSVGVGAINIGYVSTPFALKDESNNTQGQIIRTGVYLTEDGRAGTAQQIDISL